MQERETPRCHHRELLAHPGLPPELARFGRLGGMQGLVEAQDKKGGGRPIQTFFFPNFQT